jgi:hypothetical protein
MTKAMPLIISVLAVTILERARQLFSFPDPSP